MHFNIIAQSRFFVLAVVILASLSLAQGQSDNDPAVYANISEHQKSSVFFDDFLDNRHGWELVSSQLEMFIRNGVFFLESKGENTYLKRKQILINENRDYEIEMRLRHLRGSSIDAFGLTFGRNSISGNEFDFYLVADGSYKIMKFDRDNYHDYTNWSIPAKKEKDGFVTLTVRKSGDLWYFFYNKELVLRTPAESFFGYDFGVTVANNMAIEVDYLKVSRINKTKSSDISLDIIKPALNGRSEVEVSMSRQLISGKVSPKNQVKSITINKIPIQVAENGTFSASFILPKGKIKITVLAEDLFGKEIKREFYLNYNPVSQIVPPVTKIEPKTEPPRPVAQTHSGKNYLLMIGVDRYDNWPKLHNAVRDCKDIQKVLVNEYDFNPSNVIALYNEKATRENILETLEDLQERLSEKDNLLVYYAGHGYLDHGSNLGYWVPVDAREQKIPDYIRNSAIHDYVKTIPSRHTFLIVDACFAGTLFYRGRDIINVNNKSRWAFTSGDVEKVGDGLPGGNSPFAKYLVKILEDNTAPALRADELIDQVIPLVKKNTYQSPIGSPLQNVGDEGGVFIFKRK